MLIPPHTTMGPTTEPPEEGLSLHDAHRRFIACAQRSNLPYHRIPRPGKPYRRYMEWSTRTALGNALNSFMHSFVLAIITGRMLSLGVGPAPELLCDAAHGAFHCGAATEGAIARALDVNESTFARTDFMLGLYEHTGGLSSSGDDNSGSGSGGGSGGRGAGAEILLADFKRWFIYRDVRATVMAFSEVRKKQQHAAAQLTKLKKQHPEMSMPGGVSAVDLLNNEANMTYYTAIANCVFEAIACPIDGILDREACAMARGMQFLTPHSTLRRQFIDRAAATARFDYVGDLRHLMLVLEGGAEQDARRAQFEEEPLWAVEQGPYEKVFQRYRFKPDLEHYFATTIHIRTRHPTIEHMSNKGRNQGELDLVAYQEFEAESILNPSLWSCISTAVANNTARTLRERGIPAPPSWGDPSAATTNTTPGMPIFMATDVDGLCDKLEGLFLHGTANANSNNHRSSSSGSVASDRGDGGNAPLLYPGVTFSCFTSTPVHMQKNQQPIEDESTAGLSGKQGAILDWVLLARGRTLFGLRRQRTFCYPAGVHGTHMVSTPGYSFFGWACAASGLPMGHMVKVKFVVTCPCDLSASRVATMGMPEEEEEEKRGKR